MKDDLRTDETRDRQRRRFLRGALERTASVFTAAAAASAARPPEPPSPPSAPPAAAEVPPEEAKKSLDRHVEEFTRDNPGQGRYPRS